MYKVNQSIKSASGKSKQEMYMYIGSLLDVCVRDPIRRDVDIKSFFHWIKPAVLHDQFLLLKDEGEIHDNGYITWAFVDEKTLQRYLYEPRFILHPSEWNEGTHLIVVDFCNLHDAHRIIKKMIKKARSLVHLNIQSISICTRDQMGNPVKQHIIYRQSNWA